MGEASDSSAPGALTRLLPIAIMLCDETSLSSDTRVHSSRYRIRKRSLPCFLHPIFPSLPACSSKKPTRESGYWLTRETMRWFWDSYVPAPERHEFTVSPLRASLEQLRGLPPALILTNEHDVVRDEGEAYAHRLMAAGVPVRTTRYLGSIHDLALLNPIALTPPARAALAQVIDTLRTVFAHKTLSERNP